MSYSMKKIDKIRVLAIFVILMVFSTGCASSRISNQKNQEIEKLIEPKLITDISVSEDSESVKVLIKGNRTLTYTSVKQPFPPSLVLYLPETSLSTAGNEIIPKSDILGAIKAEELTDKHTTRIEISLKKDLSYEVTGADSGLQISFARTAEILASAEPEEENINKNLDRKPIKENIPSATKLQLVEAEPLEKSVKIKVKANGAIKDYRSFALENPARIVFDMFNIDFPYKKEQSVAVDVPGVKKVRYCGYPDKVRLVVDTSDQYLSAFSARPDKDGLVIMVGPPEDAATAEVEKQIRARNTKPVSEDEIPAAEVKQAKPAWVNRIDFASEEAGRSTIIIGTTIPIKYDIDKVGENQLGLRLYNTKLPDYRKRPLITTRFESAVDRIIPFEAAGNTSVIVIELRESVPYFVEQTDDLLLLHFEASSVPPKPFEQAGLPYWKKVLSQVEEDIRAEEPAAAASEVREGIDTGDKTMEPTVTEMTAQIPEQSNVRTYNPRATKKYTGEKIALDFYKTDIKNAFRILREVSGKNFAIDKDVTGEVTLTIDKPVPWDQVLDLILKMNQLGMVYEGNIIRIATLESIKKEEELARARIVSEKATKEEIEALKPLVTEYIPISYSDAKTIMQHIEKIKSSRGTVSVDERTSQIIMSDTEEKIAQAKAIVRELDKVTPQVIIEGRIVEVSSNFSRDLGFEWGAQTTPKTYGLGGTLDLDVAMNYSVPSTGTVGINFARAIGSTLTLDATLHAAETEGEGKIISSPKIVTLDNKKATITQGLQYPYLERDDTGGSSVKFKDIELKLDVTPHVTPDNRIRLELDITKNDVDKLVDGVPSLATNSATTELLVNDGDTIVIGGILKSSEALSEKSFPGLGKIPLVGRLFKSTSKSNQRNELLIFITPRIIQLEQISS